MPLKTALSCSEFTHCQIKRSQHCKSPKEKSKGLHQREVWPKYSLNSRPCGLIYKHFWPFLSEMMHCVGFTDPSQMTNTKKSHELCKGSFQCFQSSGSHLFGRRVWIAFPERMKAGALNSLWFVTLENVSAECLGACKRKHNYLQYSFLRHSLEITHRSLTVFSSC